VPRLHAPESPDLPPRGIIEVRPEGAEPFWFTEDYPLDWLQPLAAELANQCGVPHERDQIGATEVRDIDTVDLPTQPAESRAVLERTPEGLILRLPPPGWTAIQDSVGWMIALGFSLAIGYILAVMAVWFPILFLFVFLPLSLIPFAFAGGFFLLLFRKFQRVYEATRLTVRGEVLMLERSCSLGKPFRREWARERIGAIRTKSDADNKAFLVLVCLRHGPRPADWPFAYTLADCRDPDELRWIATVLRQSLQVPAVEGGVAASQSRGISA
jgi:hypothetical protein